VTPADAELLNWLAGQLDCSIKPRAAGFEFIRTDNLIPTRLRALAAFLEKQEVAQPAERKVIDAAIAYCDQLCSFNNIGHPEVHRRRIELAEAVSAMFRRLA